MDANTQGLVQKLNASWRQVLTKAMGLDDATFKLAQGSLGFGTTDSSGLFAMANTIPPNTSLFDAGGTRSFSGGYGGLLQALLPETGTDLSAALGDNYTNWIAFRTAYNKANPVSGKNQLQIFEQFANQQLDPSVATKAIAVYKKEAQSPLNLALDAMTDSANYQTFTSTSGQSQTLPIYAPVIENARTQINEGKSVQIDYNSNTSESQLTQTQISAAASGFYNIFSAGGSFDFDKLNTKAATSGFTVTGTINKYKTVAVTRGNWFGANNTEYGRAYNAKGDATIWDPHANAGDWDSFFAQPNGNLARRVTQLLLVSDYKITVTSEATYSQEDYQQIKTHASFGIWPFFSASVSTTNTSDTKLNSNGQLETTFTLGKGLIEIWGVNVENAPN